MGQFEAFVGVNFWTALFTLLNTLTIFFVAKKFLFGPVMNMIRQRQEEIDGMSNAADKVCNDAQAMADEYRQKLSAATETSERMVKEAVERGQRREEEIILRANAEASAIRQKASADIQQEKKKAVNDAKDEISEMAMAIAEKVVGRVLSKEDQAHLVDHFIDELGDQV